MASTADNFVLVKPMWGVLEDLRPSQWQHLLDRVKSDGYDAIEFCCGPPGFGFRQDPDLAIQLIQKAGLKVITLIITLGYPKPPGGRAEAHIADFKEQLKYALRFQPILINCHPGKDSFEAKEALQFFAATSQIEKEIGVRISHETHRQTILCNPFVYRDLMNHLPHDVSITADLSHWAVSLERCMSNTTDAEFWPAVLADLSTRVVLIHARVGWGQSPQVCDPEAPEHRADVDAHLGWWDAIVEGMRARGVPVIIEVEFGPYPYLPALPFTMQPVVDLWSIRKKFGAKLRQRYMEPSSAVSQ